MVYMDLEGAFDSVWRHGLLFKLTKMGICGNTLRWLESYLEDRTQSVVMHGHISDINKSDIGVPQGGVLSPILFNIMIKDIPRVNDIQLYMFADDITIACSGGYYQQNASIFVKIAEMV